MLSKEKSKGIVKARRNQRDVRLETALMEWNVAKREELLDAIPISFLCQFHEIIT